MGKGVREAVARVAFHTQMNKSTSPNRLRPSSFGASRQLRGENKLKLKRTRF
jgi:hypothetical protein